MSDEQSSGAAAVQGDDMAQQPSAQDAVRALDQAIHEVLEVRQHVAQLHDAITSPLDRGTQQALQVSQAINSKITSLQQSWGAHVAPALQLASSSAAARHGAAGGSAADPIDLTGAGDAAASVPSPTGTQATTGGAAAAPPAAQTAAELEAGRAARGLIRQHLRQLDAAVDQELLSPVNHLQQARKRARGADAAASAPLPPQRQQARLGGGPPPVPAAAGGPAELEQVVARVRGLVAGGGGADGVQLQLLSGTGLAGCHARDALEVRLVLPRVLAAFVALPSPGTPSPVRVLVDAHDRAQDGTAWAAPQHHVFKRVSALASRAMAFFTRRAAVTTQLQLAGALALPAGARGGAAGPATPAVAAAAATGTPGVPPLPSSAAPTPQHAAATPGDAAAGDAAAAAGIGKGEGGAATAAGGARGKGGAKAAAPPSVGGVALEDLLLWLCSYRELFTRPCSATGQLLALEPPMQTPLPPVFRPFMLSRAELEEVACTPGTVRAYHTHVAPLELLGWKQDDEDDLDALIS